MSSLSHVIFIGLIILLEIQVYMSFSSKTVSATVFSLGDYFNMIALVSKTRHFWRKIFQGNDIGKIVYCLYC